MLRFVIICSALLFSLDATALVRQSASQALSYKNVVSGSTTSSSSGNVAKELDVVEPEDKPIENETFQTVDLQSSNSKTVNVARKGKFLVKLPEASSYRWRVYYNNSNVIMVSNVVTGSVREVMFMRKNNGESTVYFDKTNTQGTVVQNKAVTVKDSL